MWDTMLYLKTCPRCNGDMHLSSDIYGAYKECLQCGYIVDVVDSGYEVRPQPSKGTEKETRKVA